MFYLLPFTFYFLPCFNSQKQAYLQLFLLSECLVDASVLVRQSDSLGAVGEFGYVVLKQSVVLDKSGVSQFGLSVNCLSFRFVSNKNNKRINEYKTLRRKLVVPCYERRFT